MTLNSLMHITRHHDGLFFVPTIPCEYRIPNRLKSSAVPHEAWPFEHSPLREAISSVLLRWKLSATHNTRDYRLASLASYWIVSIQHWSCSCRRLSGLWCLCCVRPECRVEHVGSWRRRCSLVDAHRHCIFVLFYRISSSQRYCVLRMVR